MEYGGKNPNGINQVSQSLLSIDVQGVEQINISTASVDINTSLNVEGGITASSYSGSYTGSFSGSFIGDIAVEQAEFTNLTVTQTLNVGTENTDGGVNIINSGSIEVSGSINLLPNNSFSVDGVDVLDSALAFSIALG